MDILLNLNHDFVQGVSMITQNNGVYFLKIEPLILLSSISRLTQTINTEAYQHMRYIAPLYFLILSVYSNSTDLLRVISCKNHSP